MTPRHQASGYPRLVVAALLLSAFLAGFIVCGLFQSPKLGTWGDLDDAIYFYRLENTGSFISLHPPSPQHVGKLLSDHVGGNGHFVDVLPTFLVVAPPDCSPRRLTFRLALADQTIYEDVALTQDAAFYSSLSDHTEALNPVQASLDAAYADIPRSKLCTGGPEVLADLTLGPYRFDRLTTSVTVDYGNAE